MDEFTFVKETRSHFINVQENLRKILDSLTKRLIYHDHSKLNAPEEYFGFLANTEKLRSLTFGSEEYKATALRMSPVIQHHYADDQNRHHPQNHARGINGMDLVDLIEMICDWEAATKRHADGNIFKSLEINQEKFKYSDELKQIFENTVRNYF